MKGYIKIEVPRACNGIVEGENDCPYNKTCPVYAELFDDNEKTYEEWERMTCEHRPPNCPILKQSDIMSEWTYRLELAAIILKSIMSIAVFVMLVCMVCAVVNELFVKIWMWSLAVAVMSLVLMAVVSLIWAHLDGLEDEVYKE